jgi:hypothetical protein
VTDLEALKQLVLGDSKNLSELGHTRYGVHLPGGFRQAEDMDAEELLWYCILLEGELRRAEKTIDQTSRMISLFRQCK